MATDDPGLFGVARFRRVHRVSAHTRVRHDGAEVFVGEHARWSRGQQASPLGALRAAVASEAAGQLGLFPRPAPPPTEPGPEEPAGEGEGEQQRLW